MTGTTAPRLAAARRVAVPISLRKRQKQMTRDVILRAAADIVSARGMHAFTIQEVADHAGLSHRSVYRYFPSREALVEGLQGLLDEIVFQAIDLPPAIDNMVPFAVKVFSVFDTEPNIVRASVLARLTTGYLPPTRVQRNQTIEREVRQFSANLSPSESRRAFVILRLLMGSHSWLVLRQEFGLDGEEIGEAMKWAVGTLLQDLERRNGEAGRAARGRRRHA